MTTETSAIVVLPPPISTNALFANGRKGRIKSKQYCAWLRSANDYLDAQRPLPRLTERTEVRLYVGESGVGNMDIDNTAKAALDVLVGAEIIPDDSKKHLRKSAPEWVPGFAGIIAIITPVHDIDVPDAKTVLGWLTKTGRSLLA